MTQTLLDTFNPATQLRSEVLRDVETSRFGLRETQDVQPILDQNVRDANDYDAARVARNPGGIRHIARIPIVVMSQLRAAGIVQGWTVVDPVRFMAFLNCRDVRKLRCDNGRRV